MSKSDLTPERITAFRACPRKHHYAFGLGYRMKRERKQEVLDTALLRAVRAYWLERKDGATEQYRFDAAIMALGTMEEIDFAICSTVIAGYATTYDVMSPEVISVSCDYKTPLLNPETGHAAKTFDLAGTIDVVLRVGGRLVALLHRFTAKRGAEAEVLKTRLKMDSNVGQAIRGCSSLGYAVDAVAYDVVCRSFAVSGSKDPVEHSRLLSSKMRRDPRSYFYWVEVPANANVLADFSWDVWSQARMIADSDRLGRWPRNTDACQRYGLCEFWGVCSERVSLTDPTWFEKMNVGSETEEFNGNQ